MPQTYGIYRPIVSHLRAHGFDVCDLSFNHNNDIFRPLTLPEKLHAKYRKKVLRDKNAKDSVIQANNLKRIARDRQKILAAIQQHRGADYALFIRCDLYDDEILHAVLGKTRGKTVHYQWDGLARYPGIFSKLPLFDLNYVFDPDDVGQQHGLTLLPATNFWFDRLPPATEVQSDMYFIGTHMNDLNRNDILTRFALHAAQKEWKTDFSVFHFHDASFNDHGKLYPASNIRPIRHSREFEENLAHVMRSRTLIDFSTPAHKGLSFRPFEALGYRKKLITTHTEIKKYDFYHADNIFIWDGIRFDGLDEFLARPYFEIDPAICEKYSFGNWIRYILDLPPHQPIGLPQAS